MTTTIIYAPHPDDETLYTAGYVDYCRQRGDYLILVAVTNGGGSSAKPAEWTQADLMRVRTEEQNRAWRYLAGDLSHTIRMNLADGSVAKSSIKALAASLEKTYLNETVEHYVCGHTASPHPDHAATALGVKEAGVRIARGTYAPSEFTVTSPGVYTPADTTLVTNADQSYRAFGWTSVAGEFSKLRSNLYTSKTRFL